jgi:hypothetical protein
MKVNKYFAVSPEMDGIPTDQGLWQLIDIDDSLHFELLWTGSQWVDVPGVFMQQQLMNKTPGFEAWNEAPEEWTRAFFPLALEPRFDVKQQAEIDKMLELPVESRAQRIAELVHQAQVDKAGVPYIGHPQRVQINTALYVIMGLSPLTELEDITDAYNAAWLHDVIEDSGDEAWPSVFPSDLVEWGISPNALAAIELLTREGSFFRFRGMKQDPDKYYKAINENPIARIVKLADMADNCNKSRNQLLVSQGKKDRSSKYLEAMEDHFNLTDDEIFWLSDRIDDSLEGWDVVPGN